MVVEGPNLLNVSDDGNFAYLSRAFEPDTPDDNFYFLDAEEGNRKGRFVVFSTPL